MIQILIRKLQSTYYRTVCTQSYVQYWKQFQGQKAKELKICRFYKQKQFLNRTTWWCNKNNEMCRKYCQFYSLRGLAALQPSPLFLQSHESAIICLNVQPLAFWNYSWYQIESIWRPKRPVFTMFVKCCCQFVPMFTFLIRQ